MEKSAEEDDGMEISGGGTIRGMAGLGRRDLTQIGKDNNVVDGCLGRKWSWERMDQFGPWGKYEIAPDPQSDPWREKRG